MATLTLVVTIFVLGYNLFQITSAFGTMVAQIGQFRNYMLQEQLAPSLMRRFNLAMTTSMLGLYLGLLFFAGFAWWILGAVLAKYLVTVALSDAIHRHILSGLPFETRQHLWMKFDAIGNVAVLSTVVAVCIWG